MPSDPNERVRDLPTGESPTSITPQAIRLPSGEGTIEGMGESFAPVLSAGTATYSVPIGVPPGRNGVQPSFGLSYGSSNGNGIVGIGWSIGVPFIARQTDRGTPRYDDHGRWQVGEDRFIYNGGQELVPVDSAAMAIVDGYGLGPNGTNATEAAARVPADVRGWQQYRAKIEGSFLRFFRNPNGTSWVVQSLDGTRFDFGILPTTEGGPAAMNRTAAVTSEGPGGTGRIYSWLLTRSSDANGSTVYYQYSEQGTARYLADVYYLSPYACVPSGPDASTAPSATRRCDVDFAQYGAHVRFEYESRPDAFTSYVSGWGITQGLRLVRVSTFAAAETAGTRYVVRRYHLGYDPNLFHSLLTSVMVEGRAEEPMTGAYAGLSQYKLTAEASVGASFVGRRLPPMTFEYTTMPTSGSIAPGFGGLSAAVQSVVGSPPVSLDAPLVDLIDVNGDGLQDVMVTDGARYRDPDGRSAVGVYWNGFTGPNAVAATRGATFSAATVVPLESGAETLLRYTNPNLLGMDVDGDGRGDFMHLPPTIGHGWITAARLLPTPAASPAQQGWAFVHSPRPLAQGTDPQIKLALDGTFYRVMDVNNDHLTDIVRTTGTSLQTWLNLGWIPGGEGRFGHGELVNGGWTIASTPIVSCLPHDGLPLDFGNAEVRLGDMNGDGLTDIIRMRQGRITYWPGRGGVVFGEGAASCASGFGSNRHVEMSTPPQQLNAELAGVYLNDVDGDGADDVVQVRYRNVDVWFNRAGRGFTDRITIASPYAPDFAPNLRFVDIDGSGTTDLLYGRASAWQYMDLLGGRRPRLLARVQNGLGATTSLEYGSSVEDYLRDLSSTTSCADPSCEHFTWDGIRGDQCDEVIDGYAGECVYRSGGSPVISTVVRRVQTTDNFASVSGVSQVSTQEFAYHDGYYEGIEQEFRGFGAADVHELGDESVAGQWTRSYFHQGRRPNDIATTRLADNPEEALKGGVYLSEAFDEGGRFVTTTHQSFTIRQLAIGLDGRPVSFALGHRSDHFLYDTTTYEPQNATVSLPAYAWQRVGSGGATALLTPDEARSVHVRAGRFVWTRSESQVIDHLGQAHVSIAYGRVHDEDDGASPASEIDYDETIRSESEPRMLSDAEDGWIVRSVRSWTADGDTPSIHLGEQSLTFDARGRATRTVQVIPNAANLDFGSNPGYAYAIGGSQTAQSSVVYDAMGSTTKSCGGYDLTAAMASAINCLRYSEVTYDNDYAQLPMVEAIARGTTSLDLLSSSATWDRGRATILSTTDANAAVSTITYDGLGRVIATNVPDTFECATGGVPETRIRYVLAGEVGAPINYVETIVDSRSLVNGACSGERLHRARSYSDGLGRGRGSIAYAGTQTVVSGLVELDSRGHVRRAYDPAFSSSGENASESSLRPSEGLGYVLAQYDTFGRPFATTDQAGATSRVEFHASSVVAFDPNDDPEQNRDSPQHHGTPTIWRNDGHGRPIETVQMLRQPGELQSSIKYLHLLSRYRADGVVLSVRRAETADATLFVLGAEIGGRVVERTFSYDAAGRRVTTTDPDADSHDPARSVAARHWRYLYNQLGDLAAVRDPRGCGQDFFYDRAGRLVGEDYISCTEAQTLAEQSVDSVTALGMVGSTTRSVDVRHFYDTAPQAWAASMVPSSLSTAQMGRATGSVDRAQRNASAFDARGNVIATAKQIAVIPEAATLPSETRTSDVLSALTMDAELTQGAPIYDPETYVTAARYDGLNRLIRRDYPSDPDWNLHRDSAHATTPPLVRGTMAFDDRGLPSFTSVSVDSASQTILASAGYDAWSAPISMLFRSTDPDHGVMQSFSYDRLHRPLQAHVERGVESGVSFAPLSTENLNAVQVPFHEVYEWDRASNLIRITSQAGPDPFPSSHRQTRKTIEHDSLYRVAHVAIDYLQDDRRWLPIDEASDYRVARRMLNEDGLTHEQADPMRSHPPQMLPSPVEERITDLVYEYDWLANQVTWEDDTRSFFERSIGSTQNGADHQDGLGLTPTLRPSALYVASNLPEDSSTPEPSNGWLDVEYGEGGNVTSLTARAQCSNHGANVCTDNPTLPPNLRITWLSSHCDCVSRQHFEYRWDELNRLSEARRYDFVDGSWEIGARQRFRYDCGNQRVIKQVESLSTTGEPSERAHLYVLPGTFERLGVGIDRATGPHYEGDSSLKTQTEYRISGARLIREQGAVAGGIQSDRSLTMAIGDSIGTTSAVIDLESGHLVELSTFTPNGARETHWTTKDASLALERIGFSGKEEDEEVGIVYFGERYLINRIGRWASPDPAAIHSLQGGEIGNAFQYVGGVLLQARDPIGLDWAAEARRRYEQVRAEATRFARSAARVTTGAVIGGLDSIVDNGGTSLGDLVAGRQGATRDFIAASDEATISYMAARAAGTSAQIALGTAAVDGGGTALVTSGGSTAPVAVPVMAVGAVALAHGTLTVPDTIDGMGEAYRRRQARAHEERRTRSSAPTEAAERGTPTEAPQEPPTAPPEAAPPETPPADTAAPGSDSGPSDGGGSVGAARARSPQEIVELETAPGSGELRRHPGDWGDAQAMFDRMRNPRASVTTPRPGLQIAPARGGGTLTLRPGGTAAGRGGGGFDAPRLEVRGAPGRPDVKILFDGTEAP